MELCMGIWQFILRRKTERNLHVNIFLAANVVLSLNIFCHPHSAVGLSPHFSLLEKQHEQGLPFMSC